MSFLFLFGDVGLFQGLWKLLIGDAQPRPLSGFFAVLLVHIYSFTPLAYLLLRDGFLALDAELEDAASVMGANPLARWRAAWWPTLKPAVHGNPQGIRVHEKGRRVERE